MLRTGKTAILLKVMILCGFATAAISCEQKPSKDQLASLPSDGGTQNISVDSVSQLQAFVVNQIDTDGTHDIRVNFQMSNPSFFGTKTLAEDFGSELFAVFDGDLNFAMLANSLDAPWSSQVFHLSPQQATEILNSNWALTNNVGDTIPTRELYFPESLSDLSEEIPLGDAEGRRFLANCEDAPLAAPLRWAASSGTQSLTKIYIQIWRVGDTENIYERGPIDDTGEWDSGLINGSLIEQLFSEDELDQESFVDEVAVSILRQYVPQNTEIRSSPRSDMELLVQIQETKLMTFAYDKDCEL